MYKQEPEKWEKEFFERFGANKIWVKPSRDNVETILEIWKFMADEIQQAHQSGIEEGKKSNRDFVIKLKADMAHAIGFCRGLGHPETYLEKNYPELCSKENK
jgi:hypothetical protein